MTVVTINDTNVVVNLMYTAAQVAKSEAMDNLLHNCKVMGARQNSTKEL